MIEAATQTAPEGAPLTPRHLARPDRVADPGPQGVLGWAKEVGLVLLIAVVISSLLRAFVVQVFWIPSPSMHDTLVENDKIAVSRVDALTGSIERGDVVVFHDELGWLSGSTSQVSPLQKLGEFIGFVPAGGEQTLVKRVIGVGGDRVQCCTADGRITVNGVPLDETYLAAGQVPSTVPFDVTVPEGSLWVMGDNRGNSADSRYHQGEGETPFVPVSAVVGTVQAVIWPIDRWRVGFSAPEVFAGVGK